MLKPHIGLPLSCFVYSNKHWGGRSNFIEEQQISDFNECIYWIERWGEEKWFIFNGNTMTCYISNDDIKEDVLKSIQVNYLLDKNTTITFKIGLHK